MSMGENHFHQKPLLSKTNFKPLSSETTFIKKPLKADRTKHAWVPKTKQSVFFGESVAGEGRGRFHKNTAYARLVFKCSGVQVFR